MKRVTIKEIKRFLKTLEENRYRKLVHADARRIAWFVNNSISEDYDTMPETMRKKWVKAEYKKERYMARKFLEGMKQNESVEDRVRQVIRETIKDLMEARKTLLTIKTNDVKRASSILKSMKFKEGKEYTWGERKGAYIQINIIKKFYNRVLEAFLMQRIDARG